MKSVLVLLFLCNYFVDNEAKCKRSIYGPTDQFLERIENPSGYQNLRNSSTFTKHGITVTANYFGDRNKNVQVVWLGKGSKVIIYLALDRTHTIVSISYDNGGTYIDKTNQFRSQNCSYAILETLYYHPNNNSHIVFTDVINNRLYVTTNHGRDIERIDLNFTPNYVSFHELQPLVFVVLDKSDDVSKLWITEDFGQSFRLVEIFVKRFYWVKKNNLEYNLVVQKENTNESSDILYSNESATVYNSDVEDLFMKDDYLFMTKLTDEENFELHVAYQLGKIIKCHFPSTLPQKSYFVVDVTNNQILIVVSHSSTVAHLYVSKIFDSNKDVLEFSLSLEDVLCYIPKKTWHNTWLSNSSKEAFADIYKVEGVPGIYIASKVFIKPQNNSLGSKNLASVITYDHGRTWRRIPPPQVYDQNPCLIENNCSLHLGQRFNQLQWQKNFVKIVSSKSAPGIILATGVLGQSLDAPHDKVYISTDAGLTWKETLPDLNVYNMGDHGGILVAVRSTIETGHVLYSTNEGKTWKRIELPEENLRIHLLMSEKEEKSTVFNIVGFLSNENQWVLIKLDFLKGFERKCLKSDYKIWSPNGEVRNDNRKYISCVLGEQKTYYRKKSDVNCYNGEDFNSFASTVQCGCDYYDFECDLGFERSKINGHCIRNTETSNNTFKVPSTCETGQSYNLTKGYRKIDGDVCQGGFENHYQPKEIPCHLENNQAFILIAAKDKIQKFDLLTQKFEDLPVKNIVNVAAIEFDMNQNCLYWADLTLHELRRQCSNNSEPEILILGNIEGMALDWISNNLYFVDSKKSKIELIKIDTYGTDRMRRTILGPNFVTKPRGIAVHPEAGYLFWTDWSSFNSSISRANLDGTNIKRLFTSPTVRWPNGITIDFIAERIYWTDARLDYIASSDVHGDFFEKIVSDDDTVRHPYSVTVFNDNIYWDDWLENAIFTSSKNHYNPTKIIQKKSSEFYDLKVYKQSMRVGTNGCKKNNCSGICVGTPQKNLFVCLSPDEKNYNSVQSVSSEHPPLSPKDHNQECRKSEFACRNGRCIAHQWRCDGSNDCDDNSDEVDCAPISCGFNQFKCADGSCIFLSWKCDGDNDCPDGSDEVSCRTCDTNYFRCGSNTCIPMSWKCDGQYDCIDHSDEAGCKNKTCNDGSNCPSANGNCTQEEFSCTNGDCILTKLKCDGKSDCKDCSDEANCRSSTCGSNSFRCESGICIPLLWKCDGAYDCDDNSDETDCDSCQNDEFKCISGKLKCIPTSKKCDGVNDCQDGSDENGCTVDD